MQALCRELARHNPGLCVVSTRYDIDDLKQHEPSSVQCVDLERLSNEAGAALLEHAGVKGPRKELVAASEDFKGHALALNLLGSYLNAVYNGDIRKRGQIAHLADEEVKGGHAKRVMRSYELWLAGKPEIDILHLLGLFDRPADSEAIAAVRAKPPIRGLTDNFQSLSDEKWLLATNHLRDLRLLAQKDECRPGTLDCHPLVREYFCEKLQAGNATAWKEANSRLYDYYKNKPAKQLPDTLEEMEPLFAAVGHGCRAGRVGEAFKEVFWERIRRKEEAYSVHKLRAFGADLAALANFFEKPWTTPADGLNESDKAVVLSWAGFALRALGRLREAVEPMRAGLEMQIAQANWKGAAINAGNLSELHLTLGDIAQAITYARKSVEFADKSGDEFWKMASRATLADALHQSDDLLHEARLLFDEAEQMQQKRRPEYRFLYSLRGYQFCDLLLGIGKYQEVVERAEYAIEIALRNHWLLGIALDKLSLGRASMLLAIEQSRAFSKAARYLNEAVNGMRDAGYQDYLHLALLARATLSRHQLRFSEAHADLDEVFDLSTRGEMLLHLTDFHLESSLLALAQKDVIKAREHCIAAKELVDKTGYHRRDGKVREIEDKLA